MVDPKETREEQTTSSVTLKRGTLIGGQWYDSEDNVDGLFPFQIRHLIGGGYVEGPVEDEFSPGEKAHGSPNVLKKPEDRDDMEVALTVDEMFDKYDVGQGAEGEQAGEEAGASSSGASGGEGEKSGSGGGAGGGRRSRGSST
jgi:hypothetical protein